MRALLYPSAPQVHPRNASGRLRGRNLLGSGDPGPERPRERASCGKDPRPSPTMLVTGF